MSATSPVAVMVHGTTLRQARSAVTATGMQKVTSFRQIGVVVATGTGTRDGLVSEFSSRGDATRRQTWPDISAPGDGIDSSCRLYLPICASGLAPENGPGLLDIGTFNKISGTSMAAPHIAGIVAQLFQANPDATPAQVEAAIKATARPLFAASTRKGVGPFGRAWQFRSAPRPGRTDEGIRMGLDDKIKNTAEGLTGKAKEGAGKATDDKGLEAEGKGDQASSDLKQAGEKVKDAFKH